jgi:hypothetical protein
VHAVLRPRAGGPGAGCRDHLAVPRAADRGGGGATIVSALRRGAARGRRSRHGRADRGRDHQPGAAAAPQPGREGDGQGRRRARALVEGQAGADGPRRSPDSQARPRAAGARATTEPPASSCSRSSATRTTAGSTAGTASSAASPSPTPPRTTGASAAGCSSAGIPRARSGPTPPTARRRTDRCWRGALAAQFQRPKPRGKPLPRHVVRGNAGRARVRVALEHVFAAQTCRLGPVIRSIGLARATTRLGLANLITNLRRSV